MYDYMQISMERANLSLCKVHCQILFCHDSNSSNIVILTKQCPLRKEERDVNKNNRKRDKCRAMRWPDGPDLGDGLGGLGSSSMYLRDTLTIRLARSFMVMEMRNYQTKFHTLNKTNRGFLI